VLSKGGQLTETQREAIAANTVCILLVRGTDPEGAPNYAYVAVRADRLPDFMEAQMTGLFYPEDFGVIVASGAGEPTDAVREQMSREYSFNHDQMFDIPDVQQAREMLQALPGSIGNLAAD